jgi:hypothetical protein
MNRKHKGQPAVTKGTIVPSNLFALPSPQDEFSSFSNFFFHSFFFSNHPLAGHMGQATTTATMSTATPTTVVTSCHHLAAASYLPHTMGMQPHCTCHTPGYASPAFSSWSTTLTFSHPAVVPWPRLSAHCGPLLPCHTMPHVAPPAHAAQPPWDTMPPQCASPRHAAHRPAPSLRHTTVAQKSLPCRTLSLSTRPEQEQGRVIIYPPLHGVHIFFLLISLLTS